MVAELYNHDRFGKPISESWGRATDEQFDLVFQLLKEDWCGLLEFPTFSWQMMLPRSLHAQVRTHRHFSYFSESHQMNDASNFADDGDYFPIPGLSDEQRALETEAMEASQASYRGLRKAGILPALARGVLPMHINLGMSVGTNLRSLFKMVVNRRCHILQGTYWNPLLESMKAELCSKVDPRLEAMFGLQPCDLTGRCLSPLEEEARKAGIDPHAVCPRYEELTRTNNVSSCCGGGCKGCLKHAVETGVQVERSNRE